MAAGAWKEAGSIARRLYDGGVSDTRPKRQITAAGLLTAAAGTALFVWLVRTVGPREIWIGFQKIGWGLGWIFVLAGLRFAARAAAWALCIEPPHKLRFLTAFNAVICGDALGNVTPLGPLVSEPTKIAYVRGQVAIAPALTALAIENVIYTLSVAAMIAAGAIALLFSVELPLRLQEFSEVAIASIAVLFVVAAWVLWRRPAIVSTWLPGTGLVTQLLGLGAAPGVTVSIVRKARMAIWSLVGTALLVRRGLTPP